MAIRKKALTRATLRELVREKVAELQHLDDETSLDRALDELVAAIDEAHEYPESWGLAGVIAERVDAPLIRMLLGLALDQARDLAAK